MYPEKPYLISPHVLLVLTAAFLESEVVKRMQERESVSKKDLPADIWATYAKKSQFSVDSLVASVQSELTFAAVALNCLVSNLFLSCPNHLLSSMERFLTLLSSFPFSLSVLKRGVPKMLAFFCFSLSRSKTWGFRAPTGAPKEVTLRDLRGKTLAFTNALRFFLVIWGLPLGPGLAFRSFAFKKRSVLRLHC